ncbi:hypothetical protein GW17_00051774 [Ensete ventricosum]|nr:hypothetical protein GW17_00051774 [Ensete ventricosum]
MAAAPRPWTREEDKLFERALVVFPEGTPNRWSAIATQLVGRSSVEMWERYQALVEDCDMIERGMIEVPDYWSKTDDGGSDHKSDGGIRHHQQPTARGKREERKRGIPWTEEEHRRPGWLRRVCWCSTFDQHDTKNLTVFQPIDHFVEENLMIARSHHLQQVRHRTPRPFPNTLLPPPPPGPVVETPSLFLVKWGLACPFAVRSSVLSFCFVLFGAGKTSKDVSSLSGGGSWGSRYCNLDCVGFSVVVRSLTNSHAQLPFPLVYLPLTSPREKKSTIELSLLLPAKHLPPLPPRCCALDAFGDGDCSPLRHLAVGVCRGTCSAHQHWQNTPSIQLEMALPVFYSSYPQLVSPRQAATRGDRPGSSSLVITHLPQSWRTFVNAQVTWVCDCTLDHVTLHLLPKFHTLKALGLFRAHPCHSRVLLLHDLAKSSL